MSLMLRRLWIQMTADRKRFGVLCAMLMVGLLLWARVIVVSNIPRTAVAEDEGTRAPALEQQSRINTSIIDRLARDTIEVHLDEVPRRDPFAIRDEYFPKPQADETSKPQRDARNEFREGDHERQVRLLHERLTKQADRLKLEAVMRGAGLAVIAGRTYRIGDEVSAPGDDGAVFELIDVKQRAVVLESNGFEFVLELASP